ncbi:acyltransferase-like protein [Agrobacterium albertimagni AOL15]|uniref:Acyltransferase-like protein n=1 Tax=Agrobacterium albertimagni AOL15 TaxID=1156935 RepID=K2QED8_9HYPH|nr:acyltransferase [Agrobacterium albertimagni]EKF59371.1 acyltransferase-like protein [Agrobacterium albertimagni AOL15]
MNDVQDNPSQARLDNLLTLRVLATFAVVFGHAASFFSAFSWSQFPAAPYIQSQAVTVFFLVSGYTIAWVCDRDAAKGLGVWTFVFDRLARLLIPLVPILLLVAALESYIFDVHPYAQNFNLRTLVGNFLFLQTIVVDSFATNRPLWTISLEFWIYLAFAGSFFALMANNWRTGMGSVVISTLGYCALNEEILGGRGAGLPVVWILGALIYWALKRAPLARPRTYLAVFPLSVMVLTMLASNRNWPPDGTYSPTYNLVVSLAFFIYVSVCPKLPACWNRMMAWFGSFAYTVYLAHYPIQYWIWSFEVLPRNAAGATGAVAASPAISWGLGWLFERRYKRLREIIRYKLQVITRSRTSVSV